MATLQDRQARKSKPITFWLDRDTELPLFDRLCETEARTRSGELRFLIARRIAEVLSSESSQ